MSLRVLGLGIRVWGLGFRVKVGGAGRSWGQRCARMFWEEKEFRTMVSLLLILPSNDLPATNLSASQHMHDSQ